MMIIDLEALRLNPLSIAPRCYALPQSSRLLHARASFASTYPLHA